MSAGIGHFISGQWIAGDGVPLTSTDPATQQINWIGRAATEAEIDRAVASARGAFEQWALRPLAERISFIESVAEEYRQRKIDLAGAIWRETGKPRWEALAEVDLMIAKIAVSIDAYQSRAVLAAPQITGARAAIYFRPHGVVAVFGPFNMPGHLPNGHLIPALLAGNTAVFKPSEQTPLVAEKMMQAWEAAARSRGVPTGIINMIQGGPQTGAALARHDGLDGIFFTGSFNAGRAIHRALADHPQRILALEMGGNNPLIVHESADLKAAAYLTIQSAFVTAGQRCSCARRLIVCAGREGDRFLEQLTDMIGKLRIGLPSDEPEPFMGTVISAAAANNLLNAQADLIARGARVLVEMKSQSRSPALLSPGLLDISPITPREDIELFGPLLQVIRVADFDAAIREANATRYGLSAGLISDRHDFYEQFSRCIRAGVVNWNLATTGASGKLPFGGVGDSGNHRPSGYFAADYCSYPVASLETDHAGIPAAIAPGISI